MQLIERYIQAVKFWLPEAQREDIAAELHANLVSQAEDREAELGRPLHEDEEVALLKQLGPPPLVAARYRPDQGTVAFGRQFIGPLVFPFYRVAVKATLCILAAIQFFTTIALVLSGRKDAMQAIIQAGWSLLDLAIMPLLLVTVAFALIDYGLQKYRLAERWDPRSLPMVKQQAQDIPRATSIAGIVIQVIFIVWWLGLPSFPNVIFGELQPAPIWQTLYVPTLIIAFVILAQHVVTLFRPRWSWLPPFVGLGTSIASLVIVYPFLQTHALVSLEGIDQTPLAELKLGKLNKALYYAVLSTWIGILIATIAYAVGCFRSASGLLVGQQSAPTKPVVNGGPG